MTPRMSRTPSSGGPERYRRRSSRSSLILVSKYGREDGEAAAEGIPWLTTLDGVVGALFGVFAAIELDLANPPVAALTAASNVLGSTAARLRSPTRRRSSRGPTASPLCSAD